MKCQLQGNVIMVTDLTSALDFELAQKEVCKLEQEQFVAAAVFFSESGNKRISKELFDGM